MHNILCYTKYSIVLELSNKQSAKVIWRLDRLRTAHSKGQTNNMSIGNLSAAHEFDYIVLRVEPCLTSGEYLAIALILLREAP